MKKIILLCFLSVFGALPASALVEYAALAGVQTVAASGTDDAERNPALLVLAKSPFTVFFGGSGRLYTDESIAVNSRSFDSSSMSEIVASGELIKNSMKALDTPFGITANSGKNAFSLSIRGAERSLFASTVYDTKTTITYGPLILQAKGTLENRTLHPGFTAGWGTAYGSNSTFGISLKGSLLQEEKIEKSIITDTSSGLSYDPTYKKNTIEKSEFGAIFGFRYFDQDVEAGLRITTPMMGFHSESIELKGSTMPGKKTASPAFAVFDNISFTAGLMYAAAPSADLVLELGYQLPMTHKETNLSEENGAIKSTEIKYDTKYRFASSGGIRLKSGYFSFMSGVRCLFEGTGEWYDNKNSASTGGGSETSSNGDIRAAGMSAGFEFYPSKNFSIGLTGSFIYVWAENTESGMGGNSMFTLKSRQIDASLMAAYKI